MKNKYAGCSVTFILYENNVKYHKTSNFTKALTSKIHINDKLYYLLLSNSLKGFTWLNPTIENNAEGKHKHTH